MRFLFDKFYIIKILKNDLKEVSFDRESRQQEAEADIPTEAMV